MHRMWRAFMRVCYLCFRCLSPFCSSLGFYCRLCDGSKE
ncbi:hypothetical protein E5Q_01297 [Mixia osmundae IAM 14324]|uniref:Uncharacterized protein n=1 Tax=Mixia osmundae (strain CBS 9802 / IAM 14324 / JCM 22182 / KY 12970) TaxID=764103 RepID=G7DVN4_MIXOS|nr:hypothetical protein E5Q_01297 [Mixia osmundae IAM 14324]